MARYPSMISQGGAQVLHRRLALALLLLMAWHADATAAASSDGSTAGPHRPHRHSRGPRSLMQYTGALVAGSSPLQTYTPSTAFGAAPLSGYTDTTYAPNPAVGVVNCAMTTGNAPCDIASLRGRGWVRGKIMGQRLDASGEVKADIGHNQNGCVTGLANACGQFNTSGRCGLRCQGQASAGVATVRVVGYGGCNEALHGAPAAQASGCIQGELPSGRRFYGRGSASAQAEGTMLYTDK